MQVHFAVREDFSNILAATVKPVFNKLGRTATTYSNEALKPACKYFKALTKTGLRAWTFYFYDYKQKGSSLLLKTLNPPNLLPVQSYLHYLH